MNVRKCLLVALFSIDAINCWRFNPCMHLSKNCNKSVQTIAKILRDLCCNTSVDSVVKTLRKSLVISSLQPNIRLMAELGQSRYFGGFSSEYEFQHCNPSMLMDTTNHLFQSVLNRDIKWENYVYPLPEAITQRMTKDGLWEGYIPKILLNLFPRNSNNLNLIEIYNKEMEGHPIIIDIGSHVGVHSIFFGTYFSGSEIHAFDILNDNVNLFACSGRHAGFWFPSSEDVYDPKVRAMIIKKGNRSGFSAKQIEKLLLVSTGPASSAQTRLYINLLGVVDDDRLTPTIRVETTFTNKGQTRIAGVALPLKNQKFTETASLPTITLDKYWRNVLNGRRPFLLKIDVEGAEWKVLQGAKHLFERSPPHLVLIDIHVFNLKSSISASIINFLRTHRYFVFGNMPSHFDIAEVNGQPIKIELPAVLPEACLVFDSINERQWSDEKKRKLHNKRLLEWMLDKPSWTKAGEAELLLIHEDMLGSSCKSCTYCDELFKEFNDIRRRDKNAIPLRDSATQARINQAYSYDEL